MKIFNLFCLSTSMLLVSNLSFAGSMRDGPSQRGNSIIVKEVSATGYIQCANQKHSNPEECDLTFTRLSDLQVFEIVSSPELLKMHCKNDAKDEKNLEVKLTGNITLSAILHDDHLKVTKFEILGEYTGETIAPKSEANEPFRLFGGRRNQI